MITTTLQEIRQYSPCADGWKKLLLHLGKTTADNEPLPLITILKSNGLDDAIWCLRTLSSEHRDRIVQFACDCAESVLPLFEAKCPGDLRPRKAIQAARTGGVTEEIRTEANIAIWTAPWEVVPVARAAWEATGQEAPRAAIEAAAWAGRETGEYKKQIQFFKNRFCA